MLKPKLTKQEKIKLMYYVQFLRSEIEDDSPLFDAFKVIELNLKIDIRKEKNKNDKEAI